jgi:PadR family transcriptional regulator PadR
VFAVPSATVEGVSSDGEKPRRPFRLGPSEFQVDKGLGPWYLVIQGMKPWKPRYCERMRDTMALDREMLKGSINLLILRLLSQRDMYGYEIIQEASRRSENAFKFKEGTLYPALHQLQRQGYLRSKWQTAESGRKRKYYSLTASGRKLSQERQRSWAFFTDAVNAVLTKD